MKVGAARRQGFGPTFGLAALGALIPVGVGCGPSTSRPDTADSGDQRDTSDALTDIGFDTPGELDNVPPADADAATAFDAEADADAAVDVPSPLDAAVDTSDTADVSAALDARDDVDAAAETGTDSSTACAAGQTRCAGVCVSLAADPANCGSCGNACASGRSCEDGACRACRSVSSPLITTPVMSFGGPSGFTMEAWIYANSATSPEAWLLRAWESCGLDGFSLNYNYERLTGTGSVLAHGTPAPGVGSRVSYAVGVRRWVHVAVVYTDSANSVFVDGMRVGGGTTGVPSRTCAIAIGWSGFVFDGLVDEVRLSSIARYSGSFVPSRFPTSDANTLALYHMEEGTGTTIVDSSGNGRHATMTGGSWSTSSTCEVPRRCGTGESACGGACVVLATDSLNCGACGSVCTAGRACVDGACRGCRAVASPLVTTPVMSFGGASGFTIEAWVFANSATSPEGWLLRAWETCGFDGFSLNYNYERLAGTGSVLAHGTPAPPVASRVSYAVGARRWVHVAVVYTPAGNSVFVDGTRVGGGTSGVPARTCSIAMGWTGFVFDGIIDEVRLSSTARYSATFVPARFPASDPSTLALYHFDEGSGTAVADSSGNGRHATMTGGTWSTASTCDIP